MLMIYLLSRVERILVNSSRGFRANWVRVLNRVTLATQVLSTTPATHIYIFYLSFLQHPLNLLSIE